MEKITGKVLVWSDQHFGIKGNSPNRQKICVEVTKKVLEYAKKNHISTIISCGDWFHSRNQVDVSTINIAYKCLKTLAKTCRCIMILGNHDLYNKNTVDINSVNMFQDIPNVEIISQPTEISINGNNSLLVPWLSDLTNYAESTFDMMLGHFDISAKYLITSYAEDHQNKMSASSDIVSQIESDDGLLPAERKSGQFIGNFVNLAKPTGVVFAGHIHTNDETIVKGRTFIFIGSPYQQTLGDVGNRSGFYVIDEANKYTFQSIDGIPQHIVLKMSNILECGISKFDFSVVTNNIIQRQYDVEVSPEDDTKINQKIEGCRPFEELVSDYQVQLDFDSSQTASHDEDPIKLIQKSKLEYVHKYIDNIDQKVLDEASIDKDKLFNLMKKYYEKAVEE